MSGQPIDEDSEPEEPFAWMRRFQSGPVEFPERQYVPPLDPQLRQAEEWELLDHEIWKLALAEAYRTLNLGWLNQMQGRQQADIVADYFQRHPGMEQFVKNHRAAGTCGKAIHVIQNELIKRREAGEVVPDAETPVGRPQPSAPAVMQWLKDRVAAWPGDQPTPSEDEDWSAARAHFGPGMSRDDFRTFRRNNTPDEWRKQGPRRPWGSIRSSAT